MNKSIFSMMVILTLILAAFFYAGGPKQSAYVGEALAAETSLFSEAGISAYVNVGEFNPNSVKSAFQTIEYDAGSYFIGTVDIPVYEPIYNPYVLVHKDGWMVAFYPQADPAGKIVDVISRNFDQTLLEKALTIVGNAGGLPLPEISYYDFGHPLASQMLLVAEYQADGNTFTMNMPSTNAYAEKSYAFYRTYEPSFTVDNDEIDEVNFVLANADYKSSIVYGTIYGHFADPDLEPGFIDLAENITNTFKVWNRDFYAFGALAILYSGEEVIEVADHDYLREVPLTAPDGLLNVAFDFTPTAPGKISPSELAVDQRLDLILSWADSTAPSYQYCIDEIAGNVCDTSWVSTGSATSASLSNLKYETTYYWQVRAVNSFGPVEADGGVWWSFTTADGVAPNVFVKNVAILYEKPGSASKLTMSWEPSYGAYYYEYCVDTTEACIAPEVWRNVGLATTATTSDLKFDTDYYWQVRAVNDYGVTEAGEGWFAFETRTFGKLRPTDGELRSPSLPLEWEPTGPALGYEYCVSTDDGVCSEWVNAGTATKATVTKLDYEITYYWQVRAKTSGEDIYANGGEWWTFTTTAKKKPEPTLFKVSPVDGAVDLTGDVKLDWKDYKKLRGEQGYEYCFFPVDDTDTTPISDDDTCTYEEENWVSTSKISEAVIGSLDAQTTYYWQVRVNLGTADDPILVFADRGEYWSFTTGEFPE
jgi:hypothetical protein